MCAGGWTGFGEWGGRCGTFSEDPWRHARAKLPRRAVLLDLEPPRLCAMVLDAARSGLALGERPRRRAFGARQAMAGKIRQSLKSPRHTFFLRTPGLGLRLRGDAPPCRSQRACEDRAVRHSSRKAPCRESPNVNVRTILMLRDDTRPDKDVLAYLEAENAEKRRYRPQAALEIACTGNRRGISRRRDGPVSPARHWNTRSAGKEFDLRPQGSTLDAPGSDAGTQTHGRGHRFFQIGSAVIARTIAC